MSLSAALVLESAGGSPLGTAVDDFRALYDAHVAFVFRTLRRFGVPEASLDDAVQDVFTVVHTKLDGFEGRSTLKTWIFGIARRVASKHRDKGREKAAEGDIEVLLDARASQRSDGERIEKARLLYQLLNKLSPEQREIFLLVELEQFSLREAAEVLHENQHTLASRLKRAKHDLKAALDRLQNHEDWRNRCET